jgi:hypothetical protein
MAVAFAGSEGVADGSSQFLTDDHCICAIIILFIGRSPATRRFVLDFPARLNIDISLL